MKHLKTMAFLLLAATAAGCAGTDVVGITPQADTSISGTASTQDGAGNGSKTTIDRAAVNAARVRFAPVIGAAEEAMRPLSSRLSARAGQHGMTITRDAESATHLVKGYFSAITDNGQTTVIYVWDVLDPGGNRLHRIQGQESVAEGSGEGWQAVSPTTMDTIADRTIDELVVWLSKGTA